MRSITIAIASFSLAFFGHPGMGLSYEVTEVAEGATIAGRIAFTGTPPSPRTFEVKNNPEVCGRERSLTKITVNDGFLQGAVIVLKGIEKGKAFESKTLKAKVPDEGEFHYDAGEHLALNIQIKNCNFGPYTGVVAATRPVRFINHDPIKHTVHSYALKGRRANILRTINTQNLSAHSEIEHELPPRKLKQGRVVAFTCDRHTFMESWMYVVDNPYFAISDRDGHYRIDTIPPGQYELVVWHPTLGTKTQTVTTTTNGRLSLNFEFVE